ncbi:hypothetical protein ABZ760_33380 [Streptomyces sp. NPDC006658]|uniref:hypothetical protein n=1 Tax=Streptomyces sp. NPDC006658 TaxID=3156900 RepID=UPI0033D08561
MPIDPLPQPAPIGTAVLPLAAVGSTAHDLAIDHAPRLDLTSKGRHTSARLATLEADVFPGRPQGRVDVLCRDGRPSVWTRAGASGLDYADLVESPRTSAIVRLGGCLRTVAVER